MNQAIRVLIVDDHRLVRAGLRSLLAATGGVEVVGEAADGGSAIEQVDALQPDVVLMDLSMPGTGGIAATRAVADRTKVLVLTSFTERAKVLDAVAAGAVGYALKDSEPEQLVAAIRSAAAGEHPIDPRIAGALLPEQVGAAPVLSVRERQVLELATQGLANKQIGRTLGISERTVKAHFGSIFRAIGVSDRTSAALWARENL